MDDYLDGFERLEVIIYNDFQRNGHIDIKKVFSKLQVLKYSECSL